MTPQSAKILHHLKKAGSITPVEAATVYKARHLPSKIFELRHLGYDIRTTLKTDLTNQRYASYTLVA